MFMLKISLIRFL